MLTRGAGARCRPEGAGGRWVPGTAGAGGAGGHGGGKLSGGLRRRHGHVVRRDGDTCDRRRAPPNSGAGPYCPPDSAREVSVPALCLLSLCRAQEAQEEKRAQVLARGRSRCEYKPGHFPEAEC